MSIEKSARGKHQARGESLSNKTHILTHVPDDEWKFAILMNDESGMEEVHADAEDDEPAGEEPTDARVIADPTQLSEADRRRHDATHVEYRS